MNIPGEEAKLIGYCGIYCHKCAWFTGKIADAAKGLLDLLERYGGVRITMEERGICDAGELMKALSWISKNVWCVGCKPGGGWPGCPVRTCCTGRGLDYCYECDEFPCSRFESEPFDKCVPLLNELAELGLEEWIKRRWHGETI